jgi:hypothetical protein
MPCLVRRVGAVQDSLLRICSVLQYRIHHEGHFSGAFGDETMARPLRMIVSGPAVGEDCPAPTT